jgi:hypothetical protein
MKTDSRDEVWNLIINSIRNMSPSCPTSYISLFLTLFETLFYDNCCWTNDGDNDCNSWGTIPFRSL